MRLFLHGELPRGPAVALVGTRRPTPRARYFARDLAAELARAGVSILSGGAVGIDTAAHEGALKARGVTVVVAPAGFERPYPPENAPLFRRILDQGGSYLSLQPPDEPAHRGSFFGRNAILAALAQAVVLVEAPVRSGARNSAERARTLGRPLLVVPSPPWNPRGRGCVLELQLGARALLTYRDVLAALAAQRLHPIPLEPCASSDRERARSRPPRTRSPALDRESAGPEPLARASFGPAEDHDEIQSVLEAVRTGVTRPDDLVSRLGMPAPAVQRCLLILTLRGELTMDQTGRITWGLRR